MEAAMPTMAQPVAPTRSLAQRLEALRTANVIRSSRARMKDEVKAGKRDPRTMLVHPDCASMKIMDWLVCVPKVGKVTATRLLASSRISPSKTLAGLTERQRDEVASWHLPRGASWDPPDAVG